MSLDTTARAFDHHAFRGRGATEVVLTNCRLLNKDRFETAILCGQTADNEANLVQDAEASGVPVHVLPSMRRALRPGNEYAAFQDLVAWLKKGRWDIVHTNGSKAGILGRLAAAKAGVPVIVHTVHGWGHHDHMPMPARKLFVAFERKAASVSSKIIAVSEANRRKGLRDGIGTPDLYTVIHASIDIERFRDADMDRRRARQMLGIPDDAFVAGTVSRLAPQKAPLDFLTVADLARRQEPKARFVFLGGGPMQGEFEKAIADRNLQDTVMFLGYRQDVPEVLRAFDVFLLTSLWEGLPLVIPQAMCASLPTVATAVDGTPEVVIDDETGFLAPPHDCASMANHIVRLFRDPGLRQRLGQTALERVYPAFCQHEMARQTEAVYEECYARATGQRALAVK